jgi:DNA polymerase
VEVNLKLADELKEKIEKCRKCSLWRFRKKVIVGEGPIPSDFFFLGQNPGKMENELGRPFVGRAGKYLDKLLSLAGSITNQKQRDEDTWQNFRV